MSINQPTEEGLALWMQRANVAQVQIVSLSAENKQLKDELRDLKRLVSLICGLNDGKNAELHEAISEIARRIDYPGY